MKTEVRAFDVLEKQVDTFRKNLKIAEDVGIDFFKDGVSAINDTARAIAGLHPHKMAVAALGSQPVIISDVLKGFAGQGYQVQTLPFKFNSQSLELDNAFAALKKDTLFIISSAIEPLTGVLYPTDWMREQATKKNIFSIIYWNQGFQVPSGAFEAFVYDYKSMALAVKGERVQGERLLWGETQFLDEDIECLIKEAQGAGAKTIESEIKNFETEMAKAIKDLELLPSHLQRIYDRSVLIIPGANGDAVVKMLNQEGYSQLTTSASCYTESPHQNPTLIGLGLAPELTECLIAISPNEIKNPKFATALQQTVTKLRSYT